MKICQRHLNRASSVIAVLSCAGTFVFGGGLSWDSMLKHYEAKRGETNAHFVFNLMNTSTGAITVTAVRPSCHCTVPKLPPLPWRIDPGVKGQLEIDVDLAGRQELVRKSISVESSTETNLLTVTVQMPELDARERNRLAAFADRQGVFKNDCAQCHLDPAVGKTGEALFKTICGICHEAEHRGQMVPNLAALNKPTDAAYWRQWIRLGKPGTLMPAFSKPYGGPLEESEIETVVTYLAGRFPSSTNSLSAQQPTAAPPPPALK